MLRSVLLRFVGLKYGMAVELGSVGFCYAQLRSGLLGQLSWVLLGSVSLRFVALGFGRCVKLRWSEVDWIMFRYVLAVMVRYGELR